jgi:bifunctional non-homologous end joining protein LigD
VQSAVNKDTDVLVIGSAVGAKKMNAARDLGVVIVPWEEAFGSASGSKPPPAPRAPMPDVHQWAPMLCKATAPASLMEATRNGRWLFEIKWDGLRGIATIKDGGVSLQSRSGKSDLTERFPWIVEELSGLRDCVLDGELVALSGDLARPGPLAGVSDDGPAVDRFIVFDILEVEGENVTKKGLADRRGLLTEVVSEGVYVATSPTFTDGDELLDYVTFNGMEGIVAKQIASRYVEGARNDTWLKIKVRREQEFVVLGYTPGEGAREWAFGALVLGYWQDESIQYAGKVGTGFDDDCLRMLLQTMEPLIRGECPWDTDLPRDLRGTTWLQQPGIVVQVAYQRFTDDGRLWHPSFVRLREDKDPADVVRES